VVEQYIRLKRIQKFVEVITKLPMVHVIFKRVQENFLVDKKHRDFRLYCKDMVRRLKSRLFRLMLKTGGLKLFMITQVDEINLNAYQRQ